MSRSPERMSSYRRHLESTVANSSDLQLRISSPSPTRREALHRSASLSRSEGTMDRRALTNKSRMTSSLSMGALCFGMSMGLGPKLDLDAAAAENQAFKSTRAVERQEMVALNDRLAVYIEKVRTLEQQNMFLEMEIEAIQSRAKPSGLRQLYESQLRELNRIAEQMRVQRELSLAAKEAMGGQLEMLKVKYNEALEVRKKAELEIEAFRPDVDKATSARISLEKHLEHLEVELAFLQRVHKEEIEELTQQIYMSVAKVNMTFGLPDLSSALKQIQSQYDSIAAKNLQEMDSWYKSKFHDLNNASAKHVQATRSVREEIARYKKDILNKQRELEVLKTRNEYLEAQLHEAAEKFKIAENSIQERIEEVKLQLKVTKEKIALLLRQYQNLLNAKMALEIEITTYRKLIEGEDNRLDTMVQSLSLIGGRGGAITSMTASSATTSSTSVNGVGLQLGGTPYNGKEGAAKATPEEEGIASENQTDSSREDQSVEMTERKTVLIS